MATFSYRCTKDGDFDVRFPIGMAPTRTDCPVCGVDTRRVFSSPMLALAPRSLVAAIDRTEKTRDEPRVVSALPRRGAKEHMPWTGRNPAWQRLPKP